MADWRKLVTVRRWQVFVIYLLQSAKHKKVCQPVKEAVVANLLQMPAESHCCVYLNLRIQKRFDFIHDVHDIHDFCLYTRESRTDQSNIVYLSSYFLVYIIVWRSVQTDRDRFSNLRFVFDDSWTVRELLDVYENWRRFVFADDSVIF